MWRRSNRLLLSIAASYARPAAQHLFLRRARARGGGYNRCRTVGSGRHAAVQSIRSCIQIRVRCKRVSASCREPLGKEASPSERYTEWVHLTSAVLFAHCALKILFSTAAVAPGDRPRALSSARGLRPPSVEAVAEVVTEAEAVAEAEAEAQVKAEAAWAAPWPLTGASRSRRIASEPARSGASRYPQTAPALSAPTQGQAEQSRAGCARECARVTEPGAGAGRPGTNAMHRAALFLARGQRLLAPGRLARILSCASPAQHPALVACAALARSWRVLLAGGLAYRKGQCWSSPFLFSLHAQRCDILCARQQLRGRYWGVQGGAPGPSPHPACPGWGRGGG